MKTYFKVTHGGNLFIGDKMISCAVLENGQRIITQSSIYKVFNKSRRGSQRAENALIAYFITSKNFEIFIDSLRSNFNQMIFNLLILKSDIKEEIQSSKK